MKGIVLAGGTGSRLSPLTEVTNKHLLPVHNMPMIFYPLYALAEAGIREVMIVTGGNSAGDIMRLVGDGSRFGFDRAYYAYQSKAGGIAHALALTQEFADDQDVVVILGDNIFGSSIRLAIDEYRGRGGLVVLKEVEDNRNYGVPAFGNKVLWTETGYRHNISHVEEKPQNPTNNLAVTGLYIYDTSVYQRIAQLTLSGRGELEITDLNNSYAAEGKLDWWEYTGYWGDAGESVDALYSVAKEIREKTKDE